MPTAAAPNNATMSSATRSTRLLSERRFPKERPFPRMAMIAMVQTATERAGKVEPEKRYYISSAKLGANLLANAVRAHWGIANRRRTLAH